MHIQKVTAQETTRVGEIYANCARHMNDKGLYNWTSEYPSVKEAIIDQEKGILYGIYDEDTLIGVISLDQTPAQEYRTVAWKYPIEESLCVHRVAVDPHFRRRGAAGKLLKYADAMASERGLNAIRIDSFSKNHRAVRLYLKHGYELRGEIYYEKKDERVRGIPFHCLEKIIKKES